MQGLTDLLACETKSLAESGKPDLCDQLKHLMRHWLRWKSMAHQCPRRVPLRCPRSRVLRHGRAADCQ
jgi:hypothetical protein